jgi:hypothetical protein
MNTVCAGPAENLLIAGKAVSQVKSSLTRASGKPSRSPDFGAFDQVIEKNPPHNQNNAIEIRLAKPTEPAA